MLAAEAQQIVPLPGLAELDQGQSRQPTIGEERTLRLAHIGDDAIQQGGDDGPLPFFPGRLEGHDLPTN